MDGRDAEVKAEEENRSLKADLKKLKDELAISKQSEHCPRVFSAPGSPEPLPFSCQSINNKLTLERRSWVKTNKWYPARPAQTQPGSVPATGAQRFGGARGIPPRRVQGAPGARGLTLERLTERQAWGMVLGMGIVITRGLVGGEGENPGG